MSDHIHTFSTGIRDSQGVHYRIHAYGQETDIGTWHGWLVFEPDDGQGSVLRTERETTQPNRKDLEYWVSGLEPIYFEGALERAYRRSVGRTA